MPKPATPPEHPLASGLFGEPSDAPISRSERDLPASIKPRASTPADKGPKRKTLSLRFAF